MMASLVIELHAAIAAALGDIPPGERDDVYAISFYIYKDDDDPRRPSLIVGYNTRTRWRASVARASGPAEAKWNYAFWLQNSLLDVGRDEWAERIGAWIDAQGLSYSDAEKEADFDRCLDLGEEISRSFAALACNVAAELHASGAVAAAFGHPIPILVHGLEYHSQIAEQTAQANPPGLADEFVAWIDSLYG